MAWLLLFLLIALAGSESWRCRGDSRNSGGLTIIQESQSQQPTCRPGRPATTRGEELLQAGWTRQFSAAGDRLQLAVESFAEMGHEVCLLPVAEDVPLPGEEPAACSTCGADRRNDLRVIYTRKRPPAGKD